MKFAGIIPARYASSRFPGKPLADMGGHTMIERVYRRAALALGDDNVMVATDDERIAAAVEAFGGHAVMTSESHRSGTDRCYEAYTVSGCDADAIINIQGDEPFIDPRQILQLTACFDDPAVELATLIRRFDPADGYEALADPNRPKVTVDSAMNAIYFSRSVIPYVRDCDKEQWPSHATFYTHVGMYGYRASTLARIVEMKRSPLEIAESLEQLRWLENGLKIRTAVTPYATIGIDTPADLEAALARLSDEEQL